MRGINLFILGLIVLIIAATSGFLLWKNNLKPQETNIPKQENTIQQNTQNNAVDNLCSPFQPVKGEISCQEAMNVILKDYPGKVEYVKKEEITYRIPPKYQERGTKEAWILGMTLDQPFYLRSPDIPDYTIQVFVDKSDGKILMVGDMSE